MESLPLAPRCTETAGPPCARLFDNPEDVLADRLKWPTHICPAVAYASTRRWAQDRTLRVCGDPLPLEVAEWVESYPLPVGRFSMPGTLPEALAALPGFGSAALILVPGLPFVEAVGFGIVDNHPLVSIESNGAFDMAPVSMQFAITGWTDRADAFRDHAAKWWGQFAGKAITGRPFGSTMHTIDDYERLFMLVSVELGRPPTSLDEFVGHAPAFASLAKDTIKRNLRKWGTSWGAFRCEQANAFRLCRR